MRGPELLGREVELAALRAAIETRGSVVLLGESGIGKTSLLRAAVQGSAASVGGCLGMLMFIPYLSISRAVGSLPQGDPARVAREVVGRVGPHGVLVLDDLQWADASTLGLLGRLVGMVPVLGGLRAGDPRADEVGPMLRSVGMVEVELGPLGPDDGVALARRQRPDLGPAAARAVVRQAAGNPLLIEELARDGVTTSLRLALAHRLRGLAPGARDWLELLAVAGEPVSVPSDTGGLDVLVRTGLASRSGTRMQVRHALIADVVVAGLEPDRRRALHRQVAGIVEDPAAAARHLAAAGDRSAAFALATRVAETSPPGLRAALLGLAADCSDGPGSSGLRLEAAEALADAGLDLDAERLMTSVDPHDDVDRARCHLIRSRTRWALGDGDGSIAAADAGRSLLDGAGTPLEASILTQHAWITTLRREGSRAVPLARAALEAVRASGLPEGPAKRVLATAMSINGAPMATWGHLLEEALAEARERDDAAEELLCGKILVASHEGSGDLAAGARLAAALVRRASETEMIGWEQSLRASLVSLANAQGDHGRAAEDAEALLLEPLAPRIRSQTAGYLSLALVDLGRFEAARASIETGLVTAADDVDGRFDLLLAQVELALATGDPARASRDADVALARFGGAAYHDVLFMRLARAWACLELGRDPGESLSAELTIHPVFQGTIPESAGIVALAQARPADAARDFAAAAVLYEPHFRRGELRCRWAEGESLRRAGRIDAATVALEAVEARAAAIGAAPLLGRIHRSLRLAGSRRSARRTQGGTLTTREREILHLVGLGLTNIEIARRMGLGRPTVTRTLSNAMAKLGADSRGQAVALAADVDR